MDRPIAAPAHADRMSYTEVAHLPAVRAFVRGRAVALGLDRVKVGLLALAISELATNTLQHTTGGGWVAVWTERRRLTCDVVDSGPVRTFSRAMPAPDAENGRGLAIVERICDEVSTFAVSDGTVVRLHFALPASPGDASSGA
jgi:serine/threonine-protein kinase RsbW